ncbi:zinc-ribbon domain-containing protein [Holzapfeliella sp. He02]|uniref:Zinc-ribbon domain-containing protein n=1 Tax=Holzapfeliella saturejae TaxID=3082953 RepID=A0ABU8SHR3_9LACO
MVEKLTRKDDKAHRKCTKCGTILSEDAQFCPKCGQKVRSKSESAQNFDKYKPNPERLQQLKQFLQNNFELVYTIYGLLFLFTLFSKLLGFLLVIISAIVLYMMGLSHNGKTIKANQQVKDFYAKVFHRVKDSVEEANTKRQTEQSSDKPDVSKAEPHHVAESSEPVQPTKQEKNKRQTYYQKKNYIKARGSGWSSFFLFLSSLATLYGVLGAGFISNSNVSLYGLVGQTTSYIRMIEGVGQFFGSSAGSGAGFVQSLGYGLVLMPILVIVLSCFTHSKILRFLGAVAALLEVGIFGVMIYYVSEKANHFLGSYSGSVVNPNSGIFGMTANIFIVAMALMIIFSLYRLFQKKR